MAPSNRSSMKLSAVRLSSALLVLLLFQSSAAGQVPVDEVLKRVSTTYQNAQNYQFDAAKNVTVGSVGEIHSTDGSRTYSNYHKSDDFEITLSVAAPDKGRLSLKTLNDEKQEMMVVTDGKTTWTYQSGKKQYTEQPAGVSTTSGQSSPGGKSDANSLREYQILLVNRFRGLSTYSSIAKFEKEEKLRVGREEIKCYVIKIETERAVHELWVGEENFIVWRSKDVTPTAQDGMALQTTLTVNLKAANLNAKSEDSLFTFTPPEKARKAN